MNEKNTIKINVLSNLTEDFKLHDISNLFNYIIYQKSFIFQCFLITG